jgi:hypothetical protein
VGAIFKASLKIGQARSRNTVQPAPESPLRVLP